MTTTNFKNRQTKKTLGIGALKGVTVLNVQSGNGYNVKFRAEVNVEGVKMQKASFETAVEAAKVANTFYKNIYGTKAKAKKAGYWNEVA